jgi:hypothetical protein
MWYLSLIADPSMARRWSTASRGVPGLSQAADGGGGGGDMPGKFIEGEDTSPL